MTRLTRAQQTRRDEAISDLRDVFEAEDLYRDRNESPVVYCVLRHVSRSGMMRAIDFYVQGTDGMSRITWSMHEALGWSYSNKYDALVVDGCGMDMGFHAVYTLSATLYGHADEGGYKLSSRWL